MFFHTYLNRTFQMKVQSNYHRHREAIKSMFNIFVSDIHLQLLKTLSLSFIPKSIDLRLQWPICLSTWFSDLITSFIQEKICCHFLKYLLYWELNVADPCLFMDIKVDPEAGHMFMCLFMFFITFFLFFFSINFILNLNFIFIIFINFH